MTESEKVIKEQIERRKIKKDSDIQQLYLAKCGLTEVAELSKFKYLKLLWLNGNKLRRIPFLSKNFRLSELYLENNQLVEITGALCHLTSLQVLMLHNNQLTQLPKVIKEFSKMQRLQRLNLFHNPVSQERGYRQYVIFHVSSLTVFDRHQIEQDERILAESEYHQERDRISEKVAFGRRSEGPPPKLHHVGRITRARKSKTPIPKYSKGMHAAENFYADRPMYEEPEDAILARRMKNSISVFTTFDWSRVPRYEERRLATKPFDSAQLVTRVYR